MEGDILRRQLWLVIVIVWSSVASSQAIIFEATPPKDRDAVREWVTAAVAPVRSFSNDDHKVDQVEILGRAAVIDGLLGDEAAYRSHIAAATAIYKSGMEAMGASLMDGEARVCLIRTKVLDNDLAAAQRVASERDALFTKRETARYAERERTAMLGALCGQKRFDQAIAVAKAQPETIRQNCLDLVAMQLAQAGDTAGATALLGDGPHAAAIIECAQMQMLLRQGNWADARPLVAVNPNEMVVQQWVRQLIKQRKFSEAVEAAELRKEPTGRDWLLAGIAGARTKAGDISGARALLAQVKEPSGTQYAIATQLLGKGQVDDAITMMEGIAAQPWQLSDLAVRLAKAGELAKAESFLVKITEPRTLRPAQLAVAAGYLRAGKQADYQRLLQPVVEAAKAGKLSTDTSEAETEHLAMVNLLGQDDVPTLREVWQAIPAKRHRADLVLRTIAAQLETHGADAGKALFDEALASDSVLSRSCAMRMIGWTLAKEKRIADATKWLGDEKDVVVKAHGCMGVAENLAGLDIGSITAKMSFPSHGPVPLFDE